MRCHAAEPGAVTSTIWVSQTRRWLALPGGPSASARKLPPPSVAVRAGLKGEAKASSGSGCEEHPSGSEERPGTVIKHRGGAPVGERPSQRPQGSPRTVSIDLGAPIGAPLPLPVGRARKEK